MNNPRFCQSCSMPLDSPDLHGTEKDGSKSNDYCKFCYRNGEFTDPEMTLAKMQSRIIKKMDEEEIPADILETAVARLPFLKRWIKKTNKNSKKKIADTGTGTNDEKHPLEEAPPPGSLVQTEEELDLIPDETTEEIPGYETPEPGEGP